MYWFHRKLRGACDWFWLVLDMDGGCNGPKYFFFVKEVLIILLLCIKPSDINKVRGCSINMHHAEFMVNLTWKHEMTNL
jgi:hypothetical protein